jgi:hypothetical protein
MESWTPIVVRHLAAALLCACILSPTAARAGDDAPYPIELKVGETKAICKTGAVLCPAVGPICDDVSVATMVDGKDGLEIVALKPGRTLCSAGPPGGLRRVFGVTVVKKDGAKP